jgi:hypothetical protein
LRLVECGAVDFYLTAGPVHIRWNCASGNLLQVRLGICESCFRFLLLGADVAILQYRNNLAGPDCIALASP